jgi:hypothetical protein
MYTILRAVRQVHDVGLSPLQRAFLNDHVDDLVAASRRKDAYLRLSRTQPIYALLRFLFSGLFLAARSTIANPTSFLTDPVNWVASVVSFVLLLVGLTAVQCLFIIGTLSAALCCLLAIDSLVITQGIISACHNSFAC